MERMLPTTRDAVAASVAIGARLGLPTDNPVVVSEGYSVRVRLDPAPVLTRVVTVGRILRGDPLPWMQRGSGRRAVPHVSRRRRRSALGRPGTASRQRLG